MSEPQYVRTVACQCKPYKGYVCPTCKAKREGYAGAGDLDAGTPNHFDHTKRGFRP